MTNTPLEQLSIIEHMGKLKEALDALNNGLGKPGKRDVLTNPQTHRDIGKVDICNAD